MCRWRERELNMLPHQGSPLQRLLPAVVAPVRGRQSTFFMVDNTIKVQVQDNVRAARSGRGEIRESPARGHSRMPRSTRTHPTGRARASDSPPLDHRAH